MTTYRLPKLLGHEVLHAQRRFIVFRIDQEHPFEGYETDYSILVFDKLYGSVVGFCDQHYSGHCNPGTFQESMPIGGLSAAELAISTSNGLKAYRHI